MSHSPKYFRLLAVASVFALGALTVMPSSASAADGKSLYTQHCQACHQPAGKGLAGVFPPLAGNDNLINQPQRIVETILKGKSGALDVNGTTYNGFMPPVAYLKDEEIVALTNYINLQLNGGNAPTDAAAVKSLR